MDPPDSMPNSEVKRNSADGSVGFPHVRVGHRQAPISMRARSDERAFISLSECHCELSQDNIFSSLKNNEKK